MLTKAALFFYYTLRAAVYPLIPKRYLLKDISNETILITGGGFGLGRLLAQRFAKLGAKLILWDINEENLHQTRSLINKSGGICHTAVVDVTDAEAVYRAADKLRQDDGLQVTMLVLNAGIVNGRKLMDLQDSQIRKCFEVNTFSHFWVTKAFLPFMMKINEGHIISIDSIASYAGADRLTDYSASKAASRSLQDSMLHEMHYSGYTGIRFTSINPYFINTGMFAGAYSRVFPILEPADVADAIVEAVRLNKKIVFVPQHFSYFPLITALCPTKALRPLHEMLFGGEMMSGFKGRDSLTIDNNRNDKAKLT